MNKLIIAAAFSTALLASPAWADAYVGVGGGSATTDNHESSWKVYGGLQFTPGWGLELGYTDLGNYHSANTDSWSLAGTGTIPLSQDWSLIGKLGAAWNRPKFDNGGNHTDLLVGLGIGYAISKNFGLRLEYEDFGKLTNNSISNAARGSDVALSLKYNF